jgi:hypothetical protein
LITEVALFAAEVAEVAVAELKYTASYNPTLLFLVEAVAAARQMEQRGLEETVIRTMRPTVVGIRVTVTPDQPEALQAEALVVLVLDKTTRITQPRVELAVVGDLLAL